MRRSAVSIGSNIAEGAARGSKKEFANFLNIAQGSNSELETQLIVCTQLDFLKQEQAEKSLEELGQISRMIHGLKKSLK